MGLKHLFDLTLLVTVFIPEEQLLLVLSQMAEEKFACSWGKSRNSQK